MTDLQLRNVLVYVLIWVAVALAGPLGVAIGTGAVPGFGDGQPLAPARGEVAGALALLVTAGGVYVAANRPRVGSEQIAADVDEARQAGVSRKRLTVRTKGSDVPPALVATTPLTPEQLAQAVAAVKTELTRDPEGDDPPPAADQLVSQPVPPVRRARPRPRPPIAPEVTP